MGLEMYRDLCNFYSHISARCDMDSMMDLDTVMISTLTSLRDVTIVYDGNAEKLMEFLLSHLCEM